jgi:hypothetical protein
MSQVVLQAEGLTKPLGPLLAVSAFYFGAGAWLFQRRQMRVA